jgi:hypothetical protein
MVLYQIRSLDPELTVAVGWEPLLGSFVGRVEGVPSGALVDPDRLVVAWFGSRQGELRTVEDLQDAIGDYAVLRREIRAALEADQLASADRPPSTVAAASLGLVTSNSRSDAEQPQTPDPSTGRALLDLALMVGLVLLMAIITVVVVVVGLDV